MPTYPFERESYWIGRPNAPAAARRAARPRRTGSPCRCGARRTPGTDGRSWTDARSSCSTRGPASAPRSPRCVRRAVPVVVREGRFERGETDYRLDPAEAESSAYWRPPSAGDPVAGVVHCWAAAPPATATSRHGAHHFPHPGAPGCRARRRSDGASAADPARGPGHRRRRDTTCSIRRARSASAPRRCSRRSTGLRVTHIDVDGDRSCALNHRRTGRGRTRVGGRLPAGTGTSGPTNPSRSRGPSARTCLPQPVMLVTGGLGHMGLILAEAAFVGFGARLVLIGRSALPPPDRGPPRARTPTAAEAERDRPASAGGDARRTRRRARRRRRPRRRGPGPAAVDAAVARFGGVDLVDPRRGERRSSRVRIGRETGPSMSSQPDIAQAARAGAPGGGDARTTAEAVDHPRLDLVGARWSRSGRLRRRQRRARTIADRGARGGIGSQHRVGCLGQRRRGADARADGRRDPTAGGQEAFLRLLGAPSGSRVSWSPFTTSRGGSNRGSAWRTSPRAADSGAIPRPTCRRPSSSRAPTPSGRSPRSGRRSSVSTRSVCTIASSTWAATRCSRCRSHRRSATVRDRDARPAAVQGAHDRRARRADRQAAERAAAAPSPTGPRRPPSSEAPVGSRTTARAPRPRPATASSTTT